MSYVTTQFNKITKRTPKSAPLTDVLNATSQQLRAKQGDEEATVSAHLELASEAKARATDAGTQAKAVEQALNILDKAGVNVHV